MRIGKGGFLGMALTMGAVAVDEGRKRSWGDRGGERDGGWGMARGWWWKAMGCVKDV